MHDVVMILPILATSKMPKMHRDVEMRVRLWNTFRFLHTSASGILLIASFSYSKFLLYILFFRSGGDNRSELDVHDRLASISTSIFYGNISHFSHLPFSHIQNR